MNTAYKVIMIIVACVVAYFLVSLATNSQKLAQGVSSQGKELKAIVDLNKKIQIIESQLDSVNADFRDSDNKISELSSSIKDNSSQLAALVQNTKENRVMISENTGVTNNFKASSGRLDEAVERISDIEAKLGSMKDTGAAVGGKSGSDIAEIRSILAQLQQENIKLQKLVDEKAETINSLRTEVANNKALVEALGSSDATEMNKKIEALLASASGSGTAAYEKLQQQVEALVIRIDGMKEALAAYKAASVDKIQDMNTDLRKRVDALEQMLGSSREYTLKLLENAEDAMTKSTENIAAMLAEKNKWVEGEIASMTAKLDDLTAKLGDTVLPLADSGMQQITAKISAETASLKQELAGLQQKVSAMLSQGSDKPEEQMGIVVTKTFERSMVMINTEKGTYVFNPYVDFTGVVRVRDAQGNEKMVLVPYTGEYLKIGENIIDTGPFARSCVLGINCNIDVRGSMSAPIVK